VWQLGSIFSYSVNLYCLMLTGVFNILTLIGIAEPAEAQCDRIQASLAGNLVITIGSFLILLAVFFLQAFGQYKKNLLHASKYVDDKDVPALSLAWSQDKSKNKLYSHLTESLSITTFDSNARNGLELGLEFSPSHDTIQEGPNEEEITVPTASLVSDVAGRCGDRSNTIDTPCEPANFTNSLLTGTETNIQLQSCQDVQNETLSILSQEYNCTSNEGRSGGSSDSHHISPSRSFGDSASAESLSSPL